jgi:acyl-CoA reductase-like NAD-dependent aldehyde dehydrogenase
MATTPRVRRMYVNGGGVDAADGRTREVLAPATQAPLAVVPDAGPTDVDAAVAAAQAALDGSWGRASSGERRKLLQRLAGLVEDHAVELAGLETDNVGKPLKESAAFDVPGTVACLEYYAGWADRIGGETIDVPSMSTHTYTLREPVGVVAAIVPWNFPLAIAAWKLAPALAAGNAVIVKPASATPLSMLRFAELADEAGFPPGALNVVTGGGATVGEALVDHPGVAKISFTGSTGAGRRVMALAADTLKNVSLELGGKSPNVVFADCDIERAVDATLFGIFANQGEVCAAGSRLLVEDAIADRFLRELARRAEQLVVGDPLAPETDIGALISPQHLATVEGYVEGALEEGATVLAGGGRVSVPGCNGPFHAPTIVGDVRPEMQIAQEEVFGPVLSVLTFSDEAEAIRLANDTIYGLVANVHTNDVRRAHVMARALEAGGVFVNMPSIPFTEMPFESYKQTGVGNQLGFRGLEEFLMTKSVTIALDAPGEHFRWFDGADKE